MAKPKFKWLPDVDNCLWIIVGVLALLVIVGKVRETIQEEKQMTVEELIDKIAPEHDRTSCNDVDLGNEFAHKDGHGPRCVRCGLLYLIREGDWYNGIALEVGRLDRLGEWR